MAKSATVRGPEGGNFPSPSHWGFRWRGMQKLVDELESLADKYRRSNLRVQELENELEFQKARYEVEAAAAERADKGEPDDKYLKATQAALDKERARGQRIRKAGQMAEADLQHYIADHGQEHLEQVNAIAREAVVKHHEAMREALRQRDTVGNLLGWRDVLSGERPIKHFNPTPPVSPVGEPWYARGVRWDPEPPSDVISTESAAALMGVEHPFSDA